jgi:uncharacterized protein YkwD
MKFVSFKTAFRSVIKVFLGIFAVVLTIVCFLGVYLVGLVTGYLAGKNQTEGEYASLMNQIVSQIPKVTTVSPTPLPTEKPKVTYIKTYDWGGPELWEAVNKRRQELGVNPLQQRDELCTIASIRLNELLELGKLDSHEGFSNMPQQREDLKWIFDKYSTLAEFLAMGGETAEETVSLWENTLGHKKLLTGGEFVWGCIYAQNSFAVAITAF